MRRLSLLACAVLVATPALAETTVTIKSFSIPVNAVTSVEDGKAINLSTEEANAMLARLGVHVAATKTIAIAGKNVSATLERRTTNFVKSARRDSSEAITYELGGLRTGTKASLGKSGKNVTFDLRAQKVALSSFTAEGSTIDLPRIETVRFQGMLPGDRSEVSLARVEDRLYMLKVN